jgi:Ni,Fe-hydrogenase maturation factor
MILTNIPSVSIQAQSLDPLLSNQEKGPDNIALFILDAFEYTFDIGGNQIFPNDTIKNRIVAEYQPSVYNIPSLQYSIMDHMINASNIEIHVNPTRIDETTTRLDFQIYANNSEVTGQILNKNYVDLAITSAYGIYDRVLDKMTIHIPYSVALQHLMQ